MGDLVRRPTRFKGAAKIFLADFETALIQQRFREAPRRARRFSFCCVDGFFRCIAANDILFQENKFQTSVMARDCGPPR